MKLLLDTHTLIWSLYATEQIPDTTLEQIRAKKNEVYVSAVSFWEIAIKINIGKLKVDHIPIVDFPKYCLAFGMSLLSLNPNDAVNFSTFSSPGIHKDPFDRMLVFLAIKHGFTLVSRDKRMKIYQNEGLSLLWD